MKNMKQVFCLFIWLFVSFGCKRHVEKGYENRELTKLVGEGAAINEAIDLYRIEHGRYPEIISNLKLKSGFSVDGWVYGGENSSFLIRSKKPAGLSYVLITNQGQLLVLDEGRLASYLNE